MSNKSNNANRITRITVRFYAPECCAPRTFKQEVRELGAAFGFMFLFAGALVAFAFAFAAIVNAVG
jgi:hypothetical protein